MKDLSILLLIFVLLQVLSGGQSYRQADVEQTRVIFQIHSLASGRLVSVLRGGKVHAHAIRSSKYYYSIIIILHAITAR